MKNHYTVKISLSRVLRNCDESTFTMFIDGSKLSIVYELTEWIRWLFSLQECFYLTHENSVIHDFEDIRILSTVKELIVKPCQTKCFHKGSHKILFNKIDVFTQWDNLKVPKIFLERISESILPAPPNDLALTKPPVGKSKKKNKTPECDAPNEEGSVPTEKNETPRTQPPVKTNSDQIIKVTNDGENCTNVAPGNNVPKKKKSKENVNEKKASDIDLVKSQSSVSETLSPIIQPSQTESTAANKTQEALDGKVKTEPNVTPPTKPSEVFKFSPKPFCIGDLLSSLREESMKDNSLKNAPKENSDKCSDAVNPTLLDNDLEEPRKKKKRKRSRGKKKLNSELGNFGPAELNPFLPVSETKHYFEEKKPNHIRFDIDNETELMDTDMPVHQENKDVSKFTCTNNIQRRCCPNLISTNLDEIRAMLNEKKQALSNREANYPFYEYSEKNSSTQTSNGIVTKEDNIIIFEEQSASKFNSCEPSFVDRDLNTLTQLKEKFPCPVVIERFY